MCFIIDPSHPKVKTANTDIQCFKVLGQAMRPLYVGINFLDCVYEIDKEMPVVELWIDKFCGEQVINIGYHSYSKADEAFPLARYFNTPDNVYECIIPRGSKYFYSGRYKEYVSETIIIKAKIPCGQ